MKLHRRLADWLTKHAAADRNSITVTIAPAQAGRTFQIELPRWSLRVARGGAHRADSSWWWPEEFSTAS